MFSNRDKPVLKDKSFFISEIQKSNYFRSAIESLVNSEVNKPFTIGKMSDIAPNGIDSEFTILHRPNEALKSNTWYRALVSTFNSYNCSVSIDKDTNELIVNYIPTIENFEKNYSDGQNVLISKAKERIIDALNSKIGNDNFVDDTVNEQYPQIYSILRVAALKTTVVNLPKLFKELQIIDNEKSFSFSNILNPYTKEGAGMIALHQYCADAKLYSGIEDLTLEYSFPEKFARIRKYKTPEEIEADKDEFNKLNDYYFNEKAQDGEEIIADLYGVATYKLSLSRTYDGEYYIKGFYPNLNDDGEVVSWEDDDYLVSENIADSEKGLIYCKDYSEALKEYNSLIQRYKNQVNRTRIIDEKLVSIDALNKLLSLKTDQEKLELEAEKSRKSKSSRRQRRANGEIKVAKSIAVDYSEDEDYYLDQEV
jgi:hypothetical protein